MYRKYRKEYEADELPKLALYRPSYPFCECAVISKPNALMNKNLKCFCENLNLYIAYVNGDAILSTQPMNEDSHGVKYIFSGNAIWKDKLIFGDKDIQTYDIPVSELRESIGEYELILFYNEKIELSVDFFGMGKWFYYESQDEILVAATSYHLLLLTLKTMSIQLQLDIKKVSANMAFYHPQLQMRSNFTKEMDIKNCFELPPFQSLVFCHNGTPYIQNTSLFDELQNPLTYSEDEYEKYLFKAKDEIIENARTILESPLFDYVLCDLSGGVDSRMMLAAVSNLPYSLTKKIRINTRPVMKKDYLIANSIINAFGLQGDDIPRVYSWDKTGIIGDYIYQTPQSYNLGTFGAYDYMPYDMYIKNKNVIQITGQCGEIMTRDTSAKIFLGKDINGLNDEDFIKMICDIPEHDVPEKSLKLLKAILSENISSMPGVTMKEKFDVFVSCFEYRHLNKAKYRNSPALTTILQSKSAFRCKRMYFRHRVDNKFQFDLISLLNPVLANIPYLHDDLNSERNVLKECLYNKGFPRVDIVPCYDSTGYDAINKVHEYIPDEKTVDSHRIKTKQWFTNDDTLLSALKSILDYSNEFEELGPLYYQYIVKDRYEYPNEKLQVLKINKLLSIYWQIVMIKGDE